MTWCQGQSINMGLETIGQLLQSPRKFMPDRFSAHPWSMQLMSDDFAQLGWPSSPTGGDNAGVNVVGIPGAPFCWQMREKLFTKNVTRLPKVITLLTCEWRALQQLAHQNPLDLTRVAITWHIKSISAPILTPPHPPFLSLQTQQTFYTYSHIIHHYSCRSLPNLNDKHARK